MMSVSNFADASANTKNQVQIFSIFDTYKNYKPTEKLECTTVGAGPQGSN